MPCRIRTPPPSLPLFVMCGALGQDNETKTPPPRQIARTDKPGLDSALLHCHHHGQVIPRTLKSDKAVPVVAHTLSAYLHLNTRPCGYFGDQKRECRCSLNQVQRYRQRISGPLLDRIDLHIEVPAVQFKELTSTENGESSASIRERILAARAIQQKRFAKNTQTRCNARMTSRQLKTHGQLDEQCRELLRMAMSELNLSARAHDRILKVSRTIADLESAEHIGIHHLSEAIQYRTLDRSLWT